MNKYKSHNSKKNISTPNPIPEDLMPLSEKAKARLKKGKYILKRFAGSVPGMPDLETHIPEK